MSPDLSRQTRLIVVGIVLLAAILMIAVVPFIVDPMLDKIQNAQVARYENMVATNNPQAPLIKPSMALVGWTFPLWMSLSMIGGAILLIIAKELYNGTKWAKALTLLCLAMPSIGGAYMLVPYMNFVGKGIPPALYIMAIGLIPYFTVILADKADWKQRLTDFWIFLMLGVTAAEAWSDGHAADRILAGHPSRPLYADGLFILAPSRDISWISLFFLVAAIYFVAMRHKAGWYLALFGSLNVAIIGYATHYVRHTTNDYLYLGLMGTVLFISLLIPAIKSRLISDTEKTSST